MQGLVYLTLLGILGAFVLLPVWILRRLGNLRRRVETLENQLYALRQLRMSAATDVAATPEPELTPPPRALFAHQPTPWQYAPEAPVPPQLAEPAEADESAEPDELPQAAEAAEAPESPEPAESPAAVGGFDASKLEQIVGGVWLQNLGAVVLLLGVFLMIVWGYTTGRVSPQVLVAAGVLLGIGLAWRGDRVARRTQRFGHALIGIGLGVVYLTLFLGYIQLHVLSAFAALGLLVLVSLASIVAGLRYKVQVIAAIGVVGAFLPLFMARLLGMSGFAVTPMFLLGYLAAIDLFVLALAARAGWSWLDLVAVALSASTWLVTFEGPAWGWGVQIGLAALFTLLGVAPLPRLVRVEGRVGSADLAVVALSPFALLAASAPFLSWAHRGPVAALLLAIAAVLLGAALWVDSRRPERDLWMPLTAAATLYATAGLERAIGPVYTTLAWTAEGVVLIALGLRPRGGWLRAMGHVVLVLAVIALMVDLATHQAWTADTDVRLFSGDALRNLVCIALLFVVGALIARARERLTGAERRAGELWNLAGHGFLAFWLGDQAARWAADLTSPGGWVNAPPPPVGVHVGDRREALALAFSAAAWTAQAALLAWRGARASTGTRLASVLLGLTVLLTISIRPGSAWWTDQLPVANLPALLDLATVALMVVAALRHAAARPEKRGVAYRVAEGWAFAAGIVLMAWSVREMRHVAIMMVRPAAGIEDPVEPALFAREAALAASLASAAWLVQAVATLVIGWRRDSLFLRWCGLLLMGLTLLKFLAFDLQTVDVFWRFLTAIVVGAVMLAFSYAYQRRSRRKA